MRKAIDATHRGFEDMIKQIPSAIGKKRGERLIEGAFFTRARFEGNDPGYDSIVAAGSHACVRGAQGHGLDLEKHAAGAASEVAGRARAIERRRAQGRTRRVGDPINGRRPDVVAPYSDDREQPARADPASRRTFALRRETVVDDGAEDWRRRVVGRRPHLAMAR